MSDPYANAPLTARQIAVLKQDNARRAAERHGYELPEGFTFYFRRYGKHGGRWRGTGPNGWVESTNQERAEMETWWMVAAHEKDQEARCGS